jgi:hypothetical protein
MKKSLFAITTCLLFAGILSAQVTERKGWPSKDRLDFIRECIKTATPNLGADTALFYCWCMQEKVEQKYPTVELAGKLTEADMKSEAWKKDIQACVNGGGWPSEDKDGFMSECVNAAKANMSEEKAKNYCECMLYKIEKKYPNIKAMPEVNDAFLSSPEFKQWAKDCINF